MTRSFSEMVVAGLFRVRGCGGRVLMVLMIAFPCSMVVRAQSQTGPASMNVPGRAESSEGLQQRVGELEGEVAELKRIVKELQSNSQPTGGSQEPPTVQLTSSAQSQSAPVEPSTLTTRDRASLDFLRDTTINIGVDGYYAYNFNAPVGRVNLLRAYDVLSNSFSLNQASVIFDHPPDLAAGRRLEAVWISNSVRRRIRCREIRPTNRGRTSIGTFSRLMEPILCRWAAA